jgi:uncharacterized protein (TIGR03067 family)
LTPPCSPRSRTRKCTRRHSRPARQSRSFSRARPFTIKHPPANEEKGLFRLDPAKKPKQIDMSDGVKGVYELVEDTLKLCWDQQAKTNGRPTKFSLRQEKDSVHYFVLKREKKK